MRGKIFEICKWAGNVSDVRFITLRAVAARGRHTWRECVSARREGSRETTSSNYSNLTKLITTCSSIFKIKLSVHMY